MAAIELTFNNLLLVEYDEYLLKNNKKKIRKILKHLSLLELNNLVKPLLIKPPNNADDYNFDIVVNRTLSGTLTVNKVNFSGNNINRNIDGYNYVLLLPITRCDYQDDWQRLCNFIKFSLLHGGYLSTSTYYTSTIVTSYISEFIFNEDEKHYPMKPETLNYIENKNEGKYEKMDEISNLEFNDESKNYKKFLRDFLRMFINVDKLVTIKIARKIYKKSKDSSIKTKINDKSKIDEITALMIKYFISIIFDLLIISEIIKIYNTKVPDNLNDFAAFSQLLLILLKTNHYINIAPPDNIYNKLSSLANILMKCRNIQKAPICDVTSNDYKELMKSKRLKPVFCGILKELINKEPKQFNLILGGNNRRIIKVLRRY